MGDGRKALYVLLSLVVWGVMLCIGCSGATNGNLNGDKDNGDPTPPDPNPKVTLGAYPSSGAAPLSVGIDASGSYAKDNRPLSFAFDCDGDGQFDLTGDKDNMVHVFSKAGTYRVKVKVTDKSGRSAETTVVVTVTDSGGNNNGGGGQNPVVRLDTYQTTGVAPHQAILDASWSWAYDYKPLEYEYDFDGDGDYDMTTSQATITHLYTVAGVYTPKVRGTDTQGRSSTDTGLPITVTGPTTNRPPVARLSVTPTSGEPPLTVTFSPWESSDPDNDFLRFLLDFNGDGTIDLDYDTSPPIPFRVPPIEYTYVTDGTYTAKLIARDTLGAEDSASVVITVGSGGPPPSWPVAIVTADPAAGAPPLTVTFYAGYSYSTGSAIDTFDWDMEGDGAFELLDAGPEQTRTYSAAGTFAAAIRVTDYKGRQATAEAGVYVSGVT